MRYRFEVRNETHEVRIERSEVGLRAIVDGQLFMVEVLDEQAGQISLRLDGRAATVHWAAEGGQKWISLGGCAYQIEKPVVRRVRGAGDISGAETLRAPMPSQVREVLVTEGEAVEKGQTLLLLEAMKMEIRVRAPGDGVVERLWVKSGQTVDKEQALVEMTVGEPSTSGEGKQNGR